MAGKTKEKLCFNYEKEVPVRLESKPTKLCITGPFIEMGVWSMIN